MEGLAKPTKILPLATFAQQNFANGQGGTVIIGTGIDFVRVERIAGILARRGDRFERRVFTEREIEACRSVPTPEMCFARFFAAKEAALKALGTGIAEGIGWRDVEVLEPGPAGAMPAMRFHRKASERCVRLGVAHAHLAFGGGRELAAAFVVLEARR